MPIRRTPEAERTLARRHGALRIELLAQLIAEADGNDGADEDQHPDRRMLRRLPHSSPIMREDGQQDEGAKQDEVETARLRIGVEIHGSPEMRPGWRIIVQEGWRGKARERCRSTLISSES